MDYIGLLNLVLTLGETFLNSAGAKLPAEVLASVQAALSALSAHRDDEVTKANLETQRG